MNIESEIIDDYATKRKNRKKLSTEQLETSTKARHARQRIEQQNKRIQRYRETRCATCKHSFWPNDVNKSNHLAKLGLVCYWPANVHYRKNAEYKFIGLRRINHCKTLNYYEQIESTTIVVELGNEPSKAFVMEPFL